MVILAASSALLAPLLLYGLLAVMPAIEAGDSGPAVLQVDAAKIVRTLLVTQLVPLAIGLGVRRYWPAVAARLHRPANALSGILGLVLIALILIVQFDTLREIRLRGFAGMLLLLVGTLVAGWWLGGPGAGSRRAMALTTSLRNVGVGLVIATSTFPDSAAVTAVIAYGVIEILGSLLVALAWGRISARSEFAVRRTQRGTWRKNSGSFRDSWTR